MKRTFVISFLLISTSVLFSQGHFNSDKVLKKVLANVRSHQTIEITFTVKVSVDMVNVDTTIVGNMKIKGDKFLLQAAKECILGDGINFITFDTLSNKFDSKKMEELKPDEVWPHTLLNFYESGFKSQATSTKKDNKGRNIMHIELMPMKDKKFKYRSAALDVDIDKFEITQISLSNKGEGAEVVAFEILSMQVDMQIDDSIFILDKSKYRER